jgi:hypothetical protein
VDLAMIAVDRQLCLSPENGRAICATLATTKILPTSAAIRPTACRSTLRGYPRPQPTGVITLEGTPPGRALKVTASSDQIEGLRLSAVVSDDSAGNLALHHGALSRNFVEQG